VYCHGCHGRIAAKLRVPDCPLFCQSSQPRTGIARRGMRSEWSTVHIPRVCSGRRASGTARWGTRQTVLCRVWCTRYWCTAPPRELRGSYCRNLVPPEVRAVRYRLTAVLPKDAGLSSGHKRPLAIPFSAVETAARDHPQMARFLA